MLIFRLFITWQSLVVRAADVEVSETMGDNSRLLLTVSEHHSTGKISDKNHVIMWEV